jgi:hypothetical protein
MKKIILIITVTILIGFGLITLFLSSSVIFDLFGIRAKEGNYVLFIVWANFISSLIYIIAAYGVIKYQKWSFKLLAFSTIILLSAFLGLFFHINNGGIYETKTVSAMIFRIILTAIFTISAYFISKNKLIIT